MKAPVLSVTYRCLAKADPSRALSSSLQGHYLKNEKVKFSWRQYCLALEPGEQDPHLGHHRGPCPWECFLEFPSSAWEYPEMAVSSRQERKQAPPLAPVDVFPFGDVPQPSNPLAQLPTHAGSGPHVPRSFRIMPTW